MYKITEEQIKEKKIMLIPSMLDDHFPLLKYAFYSKDYHPVILENEEGIKNVGLKYVNNDMCFPAILNIGQMLSALMSGEYDLDRTVLMIPQAGDMCRGSNYISILRKAAKKAGYDIPVLSLNVKGLEKESQVKLRPYMVLRALIGLIYSDLLMILIYQTRPYEKEKGLAEKLRDKWFKVLSDDLKSGKNLSFYKVWKNCEQIAAEFNDIINKNIKKKKIGITGELYIRYCHIGNFDLVKFLENSGCECVISSLMTYVIYYIDTHLANEGFIMKAGYKIGLSFMLKIQKKMIKIIRSNGFSCMDAYDEYKEYASDFVNLGCSMGDGWLIGADITAFAKMGIQGAIGAQPFGCMINQVCGKSLYSAVSRKIGTISVVPVDFDPGASKVNIENRVKMLLDNY